MEARTTPRSSAEPFLAAGIPVGFSLGDFWPWAFSDLIDNTTRGIVAEFIVARALGCELPFRRNWQAYDLTTPTGITVEVKASAYWQSWAQPKASTIKFSIAPAFGWDPNTNTTSAESKRHADVYVFCVFGDPKTRATDPLELANWKFFVLCVKTLNERCGGQRTIRLASLLKLKPAQCGFHGLSEAVAQATLTT